MTEKRFKVDSMIKSFHIGEIADLEIMQELIEEYGSSAKIELFITDNGKQMTYEEVETLLNELDSENKELQVFKQKVFDLIDEEIKHYQKQPILAVRIPVDCKHYKSCIHNQEINVCNKAKENAYRELKRSYKNDNCY